MASDLYPNQLRGGGTTKFNFYHYVHTTSSTSITQATPTSSTIQNTQTTKLPSIPKLHYYPNCPKYPYYSNYPPTTPNTPLSITPIQTKPEPAPSFEGCYSLYFQQNFHFYSQCEEMFWLGHQESAGAANPHTWRRAGRY